MSDLQAITVTTISAAVLLGAILALLGCLKLALSRHLNIGEGRIGVLISVINLALIPMMLLWGVLVDLYGIRLVLIAGSFFTAVSLLGIGLAPTYRRALAAGVTAGLGAAALCTGALVLMPHAFFDREQTQNLAPALNLGHVFIALGALITPAMFDVLLGLIGFRRTMILAALAALVPGILCLVPPFGDLVGAIKPQASFEWLGSPKVTQLLLAAVVFFFYAPLEAAIAVWMTTYLSDQDVSEGESAYLLSGFWVAFMASRLLVAFTQPPLLYDPWLIVLPALCTAAMMGNLAGTASINVGRVGIVVLGLFMGPIFPTLLAIVFRSFPAERGTAHAVLFTIGSLAALILGPIMGNRLQRGSYSVFAIPLILSVGLLLAAVVFGLSVGPGGD